MRRMAMAIVLASGLAGAQDAAAAGKPDLTITKVSAGSAIAQGGSLAVSDAVRNIGRGRAKAAQVAYLLSKDARRGKGDRMLGGRREVKPLRRGKAATGSRRVTVPATLAVGRYRLIACADPAGKVRERDERNNCRAAARPVQVIAPGGPERMPFPISAPEPIPTPTPTPTPGPAGPAPAFPQTPDPIKVTDALESTGATQTMYGTFENSMSVTAADGTTYTLTMPPGALLSAVDVTMTPVDAIDGLPLAKGMVGAVQLEPHGIQLSKPATLTIEPPADAPVAEQTAFLYHQGGHDFHLYPLGPERKLTMRLMHFSTPGVGRAAPGDRAGVLDNPPARSGAQLEQIASEAARQERAAGLGESPGDSPAVPDASAVFTSYYDSVVKPRLTAAETNDALAADAIATALNWARNAELMGLESDPEYQRRRDEMHAKIEAVLRNAAEKAYERCVQDHDLEQIVRLAAIARIEALMGYDLGDVFEQKFRKCTNFEVDFDSRITTTLGWTGQDGRAGEHDGAWRVRALDVPIDFTALSPERSLGWAEASYFQDYTYPCGDGEPPLHSYTQLKAGSTVAGTLRMLLSMDLNPREPPLEGQPAPDPPDDYLQILFQTSPKETYESWNEGCDNPSTRTPDTQSRWWSAFQGFHAGQTPFKVRIDRGGQIGDLIHSQRWLQDEAIDMGALGGGEEVEDTTVEVWHKPQQ